MEPTVFITFLFGIVFGSFLNVCIYRIPRKISIFKIGSFCPECRTPLPWKYKIPLISFILLRGRCHYCGATISPRYPFIEALTGILTTLAYLKLGWGGAFIFYLTFAYSLIVLAWIDLEYQIIPNRILGFMLLAGIVENALFQVIPFYEAFLGFIGAGGIMLLVAVLGRAVFRKEAMGMGDVKFAAVAGFYLGGHMIIYALFFSFFIAFLALMLMQFLGRRQRKEYIPLGPFMSIALIVFIFWGSVIVQWYWRIVL
ncbi:MAG: prepilin peptidase [Calditrichaeota bacterium]|nr:prepilin peptidase [Calditrichota bacterium]